MPPSLSPALRPQHFYLLAEPCEFGIAGPRPCHAYNVAAARCPRHQGPDQLAQPPLDSIPHDGVAQLPTDGQADPRPTNNITAYERRQVLGGASPTRAHAANQGSPAQRPP